MDRVGAERFFSLSAYEHCELCPRRCGVNRLQGELGACRETAQVRAARAALHLWEEPPISGTAARDDLAPSERDKGSGTVFFSGCPLRCIYCQNVEISHGGVGREVDEEELAAAFLRLQAQGALNINLVTALHFAPSVVRAIRRAQTQGLTLPIVANTSGYERSELVEVLGDVVDVWLTDFKYAGRSGAAKLSAAPDYPTRASEALRAMLKTLKARGGRKLDAAGHMEQGVIVRHLMLPGLESDSFLVLERVWELIGEVIGEDEVDLSLMNQYTPNVACAARGDELSHGVSQSDYEALIAYAYELGFSRVWWQEEGTVSESFVPAFDGSGLGVCPGEPCLEH